MNIDAKILNKILAIRAEKEIKYLGIYLHKETKDLYIATIKHW